MKGEKGTSCSPEGCDSLRNVHFVQLGGSGQESVVDCPTSATTFTGFTGSPDVSVKVPLIRMKRDFMVRLSQRLLPH